MKYITLNDMVDTIRTNIYKVPHDIDFIIGIPRSGMIAASIISEYLNVPLIDIDSFINGQNPTGGDRLNTYKSLNTNKILVIDDTCYSGKSINEAKKKLKGKKFNFIYSVVFLEGKDADKHVDLYFKDVREYINEYPYIVLYEWNIFHHYMHITGRCLYDMDGVLCKEPPDERNKDEYEKYIKNAIPNILPKSWIRGIVTYRLEKYRNITEKWLADNHVYYGRLVMFKADTYEERQKSAIPPEVLKGEYYKRDPEAMLFIESDDLQAIMIHNISKKPVLCLSTNKLYQ